MDTHSHTHSQISDVSPDSPPALSSFFLALTMKKRDKVQLGGLASLLLVGLVQQREELELELDGGEAQAAAPGRTEG